MSNYTADDSQVNASDSWDTFQPKIRRTSKRLIKKKSQKDLLKIPQVNSYHQPQE